MLEAVLVRTKVGTLAVDGIDGAVDLGDQVLSVRDVLRRIDGALCIASRKITLDQNVLVAKNVSIFF